MSAAFAVDGLKAPVESRHRDQIWLKLISNVPFNPVTALTRATLRGLGRIPECTQQLSCAWSFRAAKILEVLRTRPLTAVAPGSDLRCFYQWRPQGGKHDLGAVGSDDRDQDDHDRHRAVPDLGGCSLFPATACTCIRTAHTCAPAICPTCGGGARLYLSTPI
jgi:hypothetical protein